MEIHTLAAAFVAGMLASAPALGGDLYGEVRDGKGNPVVKAKVSAEIDGSKPVEATTDKNGRYRLRTTYTGPAKLKVGASEPTNVYFFPNSLRQDLRVTGSAVTVR